MLANYTQPITQRGYTGHEMLDDSGLIHMNGRIFDSRLSRFMQADPFIQAVSDTQSYNRYSYVRNNPLSATDPSGYFWNFVAAAVISYAVGDYAKRNNIGWLAQLASVAGCVTGNAAICAGAAFGSTYGATGNLGLAFVVGVTAGAMSGMPVGNAVEKAARLVAGAVLGGASSMISGGEFGHGFISAGLGTFAGGRFGNGPGGFVVATVVGGTISEMTGGKFRNGAASAAFAFAMQWGMSKYEAGGIASSNQADANGTVKEPNGKEGVETFEAAQKELIRQKKSFASKAKYKDGYMVAYFDENGNLVEPREFTADDWAEAIDHAKKTGKFIVNGLYNSRTESITIYRSATHESIKTYKSPLKFNVKGEYSNLESAINVIAHEVNHYQYPKAEHSYAYEAGHQAVLNYRKYKNGQ
ncbi:RHS repeat-associated core domain-containing protein [Cellvibrio japonicus]|uniref:RHS repeat-associated core domain-containing protein n=1 Tax=Cellvibrio japonicus TaxID=155077 RepID=UPI0021CC918E|nr:RHS repeat-associated core domain-containing protein [Cellvibrio japonicus]